MDRNNITDLMNTIKYNEKWLYALFFLIGFFFCIWIITASTMFYMATNDIKAIEIKTINTQPNHID